MKVAVTIWYTIGFSGILLQGLVGFIPDSISFSMIVIGLAGANIFQYKQAIKDRKAMSVGEEAFRKEIKEMRQENIELLKHVLEALKAVS